MSSLRLDSNATLDDSFKTSTRSGGFIVCNAFLISRLVILALLTNFAFLSLVFASWNINATLSVKYSAPGTSIFIIFESCLVFFFAAYAVADFFLPKLRWSKTILECGFIGVLGAFHIASAVSASVQSFTYACRVTYDWNVCPSSVLLIPLTWLNSVISLGYFLTLFMVIMAHRHIYPDIWIQSIYDIEWFGQPSQSLDGDFLKKNTDFNAVTPYRPYEYLPSRKEIFSSKDVEEMAPWASPTNSIRRGLDLPFATKFSQLGGSPTKLSPLVPTLPLSLPNRTASGVTNGTWTSGSRFIERFRESMVLVRPETTTQFSSHHHARNDSSSFPRSVDDVDQPIPLPRMSEWISADGRQVKTTRGGSGRSQKSSWI